MTIFMDPSTWKSFSIFLHNFRKSELYFPYLLRKVPRGERFLIRCIYAQSQYVLCLAYFLFNPRGLVRGTGHLSEIEALFLYLLL